MFTVAFIGQTSYSKLLLDNYHAIDNLKFKSRLQPLPIFLPKICGNFWLGIFVREWKNACSVDGFILLEVRGHESQNDQSFLRDNAEKAFQMFSVLQNIWRNFGWHVNAWNTAFLFSSLEILREKRNFWKGSILVGCFGQNSSFFEETTNGTHSSQQKFPAESSQQ